MNDSNKKANSAVFIGTYILIENHFPKTIALKLYNWKNIIEHTNSVNGTKYKQYCYADADLTDPP